MKILMLVPFLLWASAQAQVRYHFGDDPRWADRNLDDSGWLTVPPDKFPMPAYDSDGFVWLRYRVPIPHEGSPLAVRLIREDAEGIPDEVWVNGVRVGGHGSFPPNPSLRSRYATVVFDLPAGVALPGQPAWVAWRGWLPPAQRAGLAFNATQPFGVEIGQRDLMRSREANAIAGSQLSHGVSAFLSVLEILLGAALLIFWYAARSARVLLWFSLFVLFWGLNALVLLAPYLWRANWSSEAPLLVWCLFSLVLNVAVIEFLGAAFDVPRWTIRALNWTGVIWPLLQFLALVAMTPSPRLAGAGKVGTFLFGIWLAGQSILAAWVLWRGPRRTRALAGTFVVWGAVLLFSDTLRTILPFSVNVSGHELEVENLATLGLILVMCWLLLRSLWIDWQAKEELRAEFDSARLMQERLVPGAVDAPGFRIESAYLPARQVGGDFFRILPGEGDSVLVIVGDVSGKGLAAAMTVAAIVGALDNEFSRRPGEVLEHLNRALLIRNGEGFVTCCAVLLERSGALTVANAGHLAPYAGGAELAVDPELPLGLAAGVRYGEVRVRIEAVEALTFVTDGIVEAANAKGELFGFDRTREMSGKSAQDIAEAAKAWGQNDDITVVTVRRME